MTVNAGERERRTAWLGTAVAGGVIGVAALVTLAPLATVLAVGRLAVHVVLVSGAWVAVRRCGQVDLATGAAAAAGAYGGGVVVAVAAGPGLLSLPLGAVGGAVLSAAVAAAGARAGRVAGALTSLAIGTAAVTAFAAWPAAGGAAGFHAVPLLTGTDRGDVAAVILLAAAAVATIAALRSRLAAAALAGRAPHVPRAFGRVPEFDAALGGAVAGALLGTGGAAWSDITGSVVPGAYGFQLSAALALAALVGGGRAWAGLAGALVVFGPGVLSGGLPVVGDLPLLATAAIGIALLAWRPSGLTGEPGAATDGGRPPEGATAADTLAFPGRLPGRRLRVRALPLPSSAGRSELDLDVRPGEVVALVGPNGSGKSTTLAMIGGQLPDSGAVSLDDRAAPAGVRRRARAGIARTWQHPAPLPGGDVVRVAAASAVEGRGTAALPGPPGPPQADAVRWAAHVLAADRTSAAATDLAAVAARRPGVVLLDEPGAALDAVAVRRFVRGLAEAGAAVLLAEHRADVLACADRRVELGLPARPAGAGLVPPPVTARARADQGPRLVTNLPLTTGARRLELRAGEAVALPREQATEALALLTGEVRPRRLRRRGPRIRLAVDGRDLTRRPLATRVRHGLGVVGSGDVAADVGVRDHLAAITTLAEADALLASAPLLAGRGDGPAGVLSGGERRVLGWLRCVAVSPAVVVLDGAGAGLDPLVLDWATRIVAAWRRAGVAVVGHASRPEEEVWFGPRDRLLEFEPEHEAS